MTTPAYRERRRRAKLRRRARDRDVAVLLSGPGGTEPRWNVRDAESRDLALDFAEDGRAWWSTPEGRAAWTAADIKAKRSRRAGFRGASPRGEVRPASLIAAEIERRAKS